MRTLYRAAVAATALTFGTTAAFAHHGWAWTSAETFILSGEIVSIYLGNPHAHLQVQTAEGLWEIDLAPPARTLQAGFVEGVAAIGDSVILIGQRAIALNQLAMKAKRVTVNGMSYNVYENDYPVDLASAR
jgi:hypothetical protein